MIVTKPFIITIRDAHGTDHEYGPIDLEIEFKDMGEAWANIAHLEEEALECANNSLHVSLAPLEGVA